MTVGKKSPEIRFKGFSGEWKSFSLDEISDVLDGDRGHNYPNGEDLKEQGHTLFLSASNVTKNGFKFDVRQYITQEKSESLGNGKLIVDDIILTSRGSIGHIAWYNEGITKEIPFARINSGMLVLRVKHSLAPSVISQYLKSPKGKKKIEVISFGSAQPQLTKASVSKFSVSIPNDRPEQAAIGNYFQKLDSLINQHQQKHDKLSHLKKAMLEKMFPKQGETIPEIRFKGFSGEWVESPLNKIAMDITDGNWIEAEHIFDNGEYRIIQTGNIGVGQYLDRLKHAKYFHQSNFDAVRGNEIFPGDILISRLADPAGRAVILPDTGYRMVTAVDVAIVRPESCFHSYFLMILLNRKEALKSVGEWVSGTSHKRISHANLVKVKFVVPCVEEQSRIGDYFQKLDTLINQHQQQITKLTNIKQACLSKMFV